MIHALRADKEGNVLLEGILGVQKEAVLAAKKSIVTVEEIVDDFGPRNLNAVIMPGWALGAIAVVPGGAFPSYAQGYYKRFNAFYKQWDGIARERDCFLAWMKENVLDKTPEDFARACRGAADGGGVSAMNYKPNEMMTIAAARALKNTDVTFVGIGMPSAAANLARLTHAPDITLIYESGTLATKPTVLPLSIGDGELCETALTTVSVPEMFRYWLQGGRITVGFLGGAQIDKYANLNTTVVGALRQAEGAAAGRRRRAGDRDLLRRDFHHHGAGQALVRREARFRHLARLRRGRRSSRAARRQDQGPDQARDRSVRLRAGSEDQGNDGHLDPSRRDARADPGKYRLDREICRQGRGNAGADREGASVLRELHARTARAHGEAA